MGITPRIIFSNLTNTTNQHRFHQKTTLISLQISIDYTTNQHQLHHKCFANLIITHYIVSNFFEKKLSFSVLVPIWRGVILMAASKSCLPPTRYLLRAKLEILNSKFKIQNTKYEIQNLKRLSSTNLIFITTCQTSQR